MTGTIAPFVARPSIPRLLLLFAGSVVMLVLGLWIVGLFGNPPEDASAFMGWTGVILFGLSTIWIVRLMFDRDDQIIVNDQGIHWKRWSKKIIPWHEIIKVEERGGRQRFLHLFLAHPEQYPSGRMLPGLASINRRMGFGDIALNPIGTDKSFQELEDAVLAQWDRHSQSSGLT